MTENREGHNGWKERDEENLHIMLSQGTPLDDDKAKSRQLRIDDLHVIICNKRYRTPMWYENIWMCVETGDQILMPDEALRSL